VAVRPDQGSFAADNKAESRSSMTEGNNGRADLRAATTRTLVRSSTTKGSKRSADERSEAEAPKKA